jgi:hypothetical protein
MSNHHAYHRTIFRKINAAGSLPQAFNSSALPQNIVMPCIAIVKYKKYMFRKLIIGLGVNQNFISPAGKGPRSHEHLS